MMPLADVRSRVLEAASREHSPTRGEVRARNALLLFSGFAVPVMVFLANGGMRWAPRPASLLAETAVGAGAVALIAAIIAFGRGRSMLGRDGAWLLSLTLLSPLVLFLWKIGISSVYPGMMERWPDRPGVRCLCLSLVTAAWPLFAMVMIRRGSDPMHPRLTGAAIGAAVGASAWVLVDLWCPVAYVPHLLIGHVLPLVLATAVGTWLGGPFIALRGR